MPGTKQFQGVLEVDTDRGVIYFHHETGTTLLRLSSLPTPIPVNTTTLLDITHNVGVSWEAGPFRSDNTMSGAIGEGADE